MTLIRWSREYQTGNVEVDDQHRYLFQLSGELNEAVEQGVGAAKIKPTIMSLMLYTMSHFNAEEELMKINRYPGLVGHRVLHNDLTKQVQRLAADYHGGKSLQVSEIAKFVSGWLAHHIHDVDKHMIDFINEVQAVQRPV